MTENISFILGPANRRSSGRIPVEPSDLEMNHETSRTFTKFAHSVAARQAAQEQFGCQNDCVPRQMLSKWLKFRGLRLDTDMVDGLESLVATCDVLLTLSQPAAKRMPHAPCTKHAAEIIFQG